MKNLNIAYGNTPEPNRKDEPYAQLWLEYVQLLEHVRAIDDARRVPERTLLNLALIGGAPGAVAAQQMLRHKTRKEPFRTQLWLIAAAWLALLCWAALRVA